MIKVLVVSDSHKNQKLLRQVLSQNQDVDYIIHLGDDYEDLDGNFDLTGGKEIIKVPGIWHSGYYSRNLPITRELVIGDFKIGCLHTLTDKRKLSNDCDIILYGHTHKPEIRKIIDKIELNPGHLKYIEDRGNTASYGRLTIDNAKIIMEIFDYNCNLIEASTLEKVKK
jgi:uncharacterized protein